MPLTGVVVPFGAPDPRRARLLDHVLAHLAPLDVHVGTHEGVWSKGAALAGAVEQTCADVLVMCDADVLVDRGALAACVAAVAAGYSWAVPHTWVHRLDEPTTDLVLSGAGIPEQPALARLAYRGVVGGGCVVLARAAWAECPVDPRFVGWGGEDEAWGWALSCLYGPPWAPHGHEDRLWHLWHPHAAPRQRRPVTGESRALRAAYRNARGTPRLMRAVIAGTDPDPPVVLDVPVRFRLAPGTGGVPRVRAFNAGGHAVRFVAGELTTVDGDVVEILERTPGVVRADG